MDTPTKIRQPAMQSIVRRVRIALMLMKTALVLLLTFAAHAAAAPHWVATWGASPAPQLADEAQMRTAKLEFDNQTLREIVHTSIGSDTVRVRLSNAYGKQTVEIGAAHIALRAKGIGDRRRIRSRAHVQRPRRPSRFRRTRWS